MESLLVHLMVWGKAQGYRWFVLGMAPLSGFEHSPVAPLWNRLGAFLYEHGEALYNFQGLRAYKEKFDPVWEPCYLAYPGGLKLARVLADVVGARGGRVRRSSSNDDRVEWRERRTGCPAAGKRLAHRRLVGGCTHADRTGSGPDTDFLHAIVWHGGSLCADPAARAGGAVCLRRWRMEPRRRVDG